MKTVFLCFVQQSRLLGIITVVPDNCTCDHGYLSAARTGAAEYCCSDSENVFLVDGKDILARNDWH